MKKGLIIFGVCILGFAWIMSTMIDFADKSIEKQREKLGNYAELLKMANDFLKVKFDTFEIEVKGKDFLIYKMTKKEMLIKGSIDNVRFIR